MTISIRSDRRNIVAQIEVRDGFVLEESLKGCYISDIDLNDDGSIHYRIDMNPPQEFVEGLSNDTLLDEIKTRMCQ